MPNNLALQLFFGTLPLIVVIFAIWPRLRLLLTDILACLRRIENSLREQGELIEEDMKKWSGVKEGIKKGQRPN